MNELIGMLKRQEAKRPKNSLQTLETKLPRNQENNRHKRTHKKGCRERKDHKISHRPVEQKTLKNKTTGKLPFRKMCISIMDNNGIWVCYLYIMVYFFLTWLEPKSSCGFDGICIKMPLPPAPRSTNLPWRRPPKRECPFDRLDWKIRKSAVQVNRWPKLMPPPKAHY